MKYGKYKNPLTFKNKLGRAIWNIIWWILFRPFGTPFLNTWRIYLLRIFGAKIGKNCKIQSTVKVWAPWNLQMGDLVACGFDVLIYNPGKIKFGSKITISQRAHLCSASHDINSKKSDLITKPITVNDRAWIATDTFIGLGVTIGEGAVIGARAAVFKDVDPWTVVGGNPATFIKKREFEKGADEA